MLIKTELSKKFCLRVSGNILCIQHISDGISAAILLTYSAGHFLINGKIMHKMLKHIHLLKKEHMGTYTDGLGEVFDGNRNHQPAED